MKLFFNRQIIGTSIQKFQIQQLHIFPIKKKSLEKPVFSTSVCMCIHIHNSLLISTDTRYYTLKFKK